jgi:hypothetical protein
MAKPKWEVIVTNESGEIQTHRCRKHLRAIGIMDRALERGCQAELKLIHERPRQTQKYVNRRPMARRVAA